MQKHAAMRLIDKHIYTEICIKDACVYTFTGPCLHAKKEIQRHRGANADTQMIAKSSC